MEDTVTKVVFTDYVISLYLIFHILFQGTNKHKEYCGDERITDASFKTKFTFRTREPQQS